MPQCPALGVDGLLVGGEEDGFAFERKCHVFDFHIRSTGSASWAFCKAWCDKTMQPLPKILPNGTKQMTARPSVF